MRKIELHWRTFLLMLRRAPQDEAARQGLFRLLFLVLYVSGYAFYLKREFREVGIGGMILSAVLLALGLLVALWIARNNRLTATTTLNLVSPSKSETGDPDLTQHRHALVQELLRAAILVDRAGIEAVNLTGVQNPAHTGAARQRTLQAAKSTGVWESLTVTEQELLTSPEGGWPAEAVWTTVARAEDVRGLRWVVGIDAVLTPFHFLEQELVSSVSLSTKPALTEGHTCMQPWDIRPAQGAAQTMAMYCLAAGIKRGLYSVEDQAAREEYLRIAERTDRTLLIGGTTVEDATEEEIRRTCAAAIRRTRVLTAVIDFLHTDGSRPFQVDHPADEGLASPDSS